MDRPGRLISDKMRLIENLTGVNSSKLNYYLDYKQRSRQMEKKNHSLEIIHQLVRDINIDTPIPDMITRAYQRLPLVLDCDFLGLFLLRQDALWLTASVPACPELTSPIPGDSLLWSVLRSKQGGYYYLPRHADLWECYLVRNFSLGSVALMPLLVKNRVIGVLMVGSQQQEAYQESELSFVQQLADQLAICIENARLYEEVLRGKNEWEETFRAVIDPIFLIDLNFNILRSNERLEGACRLSSGSWQGRKCYELLWGRRTKCEVCLLDEVCRTQNDAYRRMQLDSGQVWDVYYYPVFNRQGQIYAVIHHIKDVTEKVKMEAGLLQSAKLAAIGEMAAGVAHELNSPLTVIIGNAQMLLRDLPSDHPAVELVRDVLNCGLRCKKIIQNLLTFARQDQHPLAPTRINDVVERVLSLLRYQLSRGGITVKCELAEDLPPVLANGQQLDQVLINFLLNARDALENTSGPRLITVRTARRPGMPGEVTLTVADNGEGITPENLPRIFNPFFTSKEASKGTGLGLSVSLGIAQAHGGTIEVESRPGEGSSFTLVLPLRGEDV